MLRILNISKKFGSQTALEAVNLEIRAGEFFSLLGPSGCGKTTLLRIISGFETASTGELYWDQTRIDTIRPQDRPFNMVFQRYALFPHLTVYENVAFGLKVKRVEGEAVKRRVEDVLKLVDLWDFRDRLPDTLSGGQAQRVAIARAVVNEPKILLLDEPLSALDQKLREHMQTELRLLQKRLGITFIFVTHDQEEALALSDRIGVMNNGVLEQVSTPQDLYFHPKTLFVAQFVGAMGSIKGDGLYGNGSGQTEVKHGSGALIRGMGSVEQNGPVMAFVRPEKVRLGGSRSLNVVAGKVSSVLYKGAHYEIHLEVSPSEYIRALVPASEVTEPVHVGKAMKMNFAPEDTFVFEHKAWHKNR